MNPKITLRASAASRWLVCAAARTAGDSTEAPSEAAAEGTASHLIARYSDKIPALRDLAGWLVEGEFKKVQALAEAYLRSSGASFKKEYQAFSSWGAFNKAAYRIYRHEENPPDLFTTPSSQDLAWYDRKLEVIKPWYEPLAAGFKWEAREMHMTLPLGNGVTLEGTCDRAWLDLNGTLHIDDLKSGEGFTTVADHRDQLRTYFTLLTSKAIFCEGVKSVSLSVFNPSAGWTHEDFDFPTRTKRAESLAELKVLALDLSDSRVAGAHCRYCPLRDGCQAYLASLEGAALDVVPAPVLSAMPTLTDAQAVRILSQRAKLDKWLDGLADSLKARLEAGEDIPGVSLKTGRKTRVWADPAKVEEQLAPFCEVHELVSPAKAEKAGAPSALVAELTTEVVGKKTLEFSDALSALE